MPPKRWHQTRLTNYSRTYPRRLQSHVADDILLQSMYEFICCRNCLFLPLFLLVCHCHHAAHHDVMMSLPAQPMCGSTTQSAMEAAKPTAQMPVKTLFLTLTGGYCQLCGMAPLYSSYTELNTMSVNKL